METASRSNQIEKMKNEMMKVTNKDKGNKKVHINFVAYSVSTVLGTM